MATIELYKPHPKQLEIHQALDRPDIMYCVVPTGRQFGKTMLAENQAVKWCIENKNWNVAWISPTYKQCKKVFREMKNNLGDCPAFAKPPNQSDLIFYFGNGSQLIFYSAEAYDSIRGESFTGMVCDEFRFFNQHAWTEGIKPTLTVTGKKVLIISTPKGKGEFYNLFQLGKSEPRYISFTADSYSNPYANKSEIDDARRTLPDHIFRQEYLAEFLEDGSEVFPNINESVKTGTKGSRCYAGIDLGRANDYTVLTIVDENDNELYCERWRHMEWSKIIDNVVTILNQYQPYTFIESNGAQDAIFEMIRNKVTFGKSRVEPFITTSKTKQEIVENLIVAFEQKQIGIIGHDWQVGELQSFSYEYNVKTRQIKYSAPIGLHDDYVMSRAITSHARKEMKSKGNFSFKQL
jgi:hypothetical protein